MGFDEWYEDITMIDCTISGAYEAGAASRQAEVDALNALSEMSERKIDDLVLRNIELQKLIDILECSLKTIKENLDLHDCESCWQHYFEIENVFLSISDKGKKDE